MLIGHYAIALSAKKLAPRTSLGTLIAAAVFLDLLWPILVLAGIEQVAVTPGATAVTPLDFVSYPYSHSLAMSAIWGIAFAVLYLAMRRDPQGAGILGLLVVSHWFLDAVVHRPDLPLAPGSTMRVGLGLWNSIPGTLIVELALFAGGVWIYAHATRARDEIGFFGFTAFVVLLCAIYAIAIFGPSPSSAAVVAWTGNAQWLVVVLAAWIDRHRKPTTHKF